MNALTRVTEGVRRAASQLSERGEQPQRSAARRLPDPVSPIPVEQAEMAVASDQAAYNQAVPLGVRVAAGWAWCLLVIALGVLAAGYLFGKLSEVVIPVAVAILLTALLSPVARWLRRVGVPAGLAAGIALLGGIIVVAGALTLIGSQIAGQAGALGQQAISGVQTFLNWLAGSPLHIDQSRITQLLPQLQKWVTDSSGAIAGYAAGVGSTVGHFAAGIAITLFATFFFLFEGRTIWRFLLNLFPRVSRRRVDEATRLGWNSLVSFVRATIIVAFADALGVLIVAMILRVPLAPALAALVFFGAFIPIVGAFVSGFVAVAVALVTLGWVQALIMLAGIILVMQIEGHGLQPFLLGRAVALHPLAIILGIAIGIVVGGIVGALVIVPIMAFGKSFIQHLASSSRNIDLRRHIIV